MIAAIGEFKPGVIICEGVMGCLEYRGEQCTYIDLSKIYIYFCTRVSELQLCM